MNSNKKGLGFMDALTLVFIALKLSRNINWSWWWVLSPIWGTVGLVSIVVLLGSFVGEGE